MAPKQKNSWESLNFIKRKRKKQKTLEKLKKLQGKNAENEKVKIVEFSEPITLSIAVPGSILDNAQSPELRTYLAGQIARAACIYQVDEIVVFNDCGTEENSYTAASKKGKLKSCLQLATILQYLECPQYLRKHLFPIQNSLKYAGILNPLEAPHHLRKNDDFLFREGVVLTLPPKSGKGSYVDVGLDKPVTIDRILEPYCRVTVKLETSDYNKLKGTVVSPLIPKRESGRYWGYRVRIAKSLNQVLTSSTFCNNYDLTIGTSDKGTPVDNLSFEEKSYRHCLIVFGGLQGLEFALENDEILKADDVSLLFDHYVNTCPVQACRTVRTEEAILISLAELRKKFSKPNS